MRILNNLISRTKRHRKHEEGSAIVELALVFPLLSLLVLGAAELGRIAYAAIDVTNAAHAGVQYGAASHTAATDFVNSSGTYSGGIVTAALADADPLGGSSTLTVTSISNACVCANPKYVPLSCSDNSTCSSHNTTMEETLTVYTQATFNPLFKWPNGPAQVTLYGKAVQRVSNQ
jgi:Flp pilus assembly protein TadG